MNTNDEKENYIYCSHCGSKIFADSKFCRKCGNPIKNIEEEEELKDGAISWEYGYSFVSEKIEKCPKCGETLGKHQTVCTVCGYDILHSDDDVMSDEACDEVSYKCPNCGEPLNPGQTVCDACGYFIRGMKSKKVAEDLFKELRAIDVRPMPTDNTKSLSKFLFGIESDKERIERKKREREFNLSKIAEKHRLVRSYPLPNSESELIDFLGIAGSMIVVNETSKIEDNAWYQKFCQTYERLETLMCGRSDFFKIQQMYNKKINEIDAEIKQEKRKTRKGLFMVGVCEGILVLMLLLMTYPIQTITVIIVVVILAIIFVICRHKRNRNIHKKEG